MLSVPLKLRRSVVIGEKKNIYIYIFLLITPWILCFLKDDLLVISIHTIMEE